MHGDVVISHRSLKEKINKQNFWYKLQILFYSEFVCDYVMTVILEVAAEQNLSNSDTGQTTSCPSRLADSEVVCGLPRGCCWNGPPGIYKHTPAVTRGRVALDRLVEPFLGTVWDEDSFWFLMLHLLQGRLQLLITRKRW